MSDLGEDPLVARLTALLSAGRGVLAGPGDDCAVLAGGRSGQVALLKTDCLVEGVHFLPGAPAAKVGWKAVARVLSDFAAMGGAADHLLVTLVLPPERPVRWVEALYRGMDRCAARFGAAIVGGETSSVPAGGTAAISVAAAGHAARRRLVLRSGGRPGDLLFVTGRLGGSRAGRHLTFTPRIVESAWLTGRFRVHAMMDLSDGLAADLPRLARASGCGFELDERSLPRRRGADLAAALGDGEDYELLFAVAPRQRNRLRQSWKRAFPSLPLSCIGTLTRGEPPAPRGGWDHFRRSTRS